MGQSQSAQAAPPRSREELTRELAHKFAERCYTPLEAYSLDDVFRSLASSSSAIQHIDEATLARFLEIPDVLHASPVLFRLATYVGAFPFLRDAPAVLGRDQLVVVVTLLTARYRRVLARGDRDRRTLLFKGLAVWDRKLAGRMGRKEEEGGEQGEATSEGDKKEPSGATGFAIDHPGDEEEDEDDLADEDDALVLAALEALDYTAGLPRDGARRNTTTATTHAAMIPADNFRRLVVLLLLAAPLGPQESLAAHAHRIVGPELAGLRAAAASVLAAFLDVETAPGIRFGAFDVVVPVCFPYLFQGLENLFEKFLFSKALDLNKHKSSNASSPTNATQTQIAIPPTLPQPLLQDTASIMSLTVLSQLSFFLPGSELLFRRLRLLYAGEHDGFSMGSFETKVFHWRAPTILLVRGTRLSTSTKNVAHGPEAVFAASLPPKRFPDGSGSSSSSEDDDDPQQLTFGVLVGEPWRHTHRECFGGADTTLFQLEPVHDVFRASATNTDYVSFAKTAPSTVHAGISFGCPPPGGASTRRTSPGLLSLGPVSLVLDGSFEFGCFTHDFGAARGGAFGSSVVRPRNFQDRFAVESLEVWGCGGAEEAKQQADRWAWEAREAEARRRVNLGTGDRDADRALLEMAGLVGGGNRSGGSMM